MRTDTTPDRDFSQHEPGSSDCVIIQGENLPTPAPAIVLPATKSGIAVAIVWRTTPMLNTTHATADCQSEIETSELCHTNKSHLPADSVSN